MSKMLRNSFSQPAGKWSNSLREGHSSLDARLSGGCPEATLALGWGVDPATTCGWRGTTPS